MAHSDVPTINLFDNDNSSASFFETFSQGSNDHNQPSVDMFQSSIQQPNTLNYSQDQQQVNHHDSPFQTQGDDGQSLFGKTDSHSFFDTLTTEQSEPIHHQSPPPHTPPASHAPSPPYSAPPSTTPVAEPVVDYSHQPQHQESSPFASSDSSDPNTLFFENLSISGDNQIAASIPPAHNPATPTHTSPLPQTIPPAPYPSTPTHTNIHTPHSALVAPLPSTPPLRSSTEAFSPLPRRGSANDLPNAYEHVPPPPSPLGRVSSYNDALSQLDSSTPPTTRPAFTSFPPLSSFPPPSTFGFHTGSSSSSPATSRPQSPGIAPPSPAPSKHTSETSPLLVHNPAHHVHEADPFATSSPVPTTPPLTSSTSSIPPVEPTHTPETTSAPTPFALDSGETIPFGSAQEAPIPFGGAEEAPIPFGSTEEAPIPFGNSGDDQNIFDSFLGGSSQGQSSFVEQSVSSHTYDSIASSTENYQYSYSQTQSPDATQQDAQSSQYSQYYNYGYGQYDQYGNQKTDNTHQYSGQTATAAAAAAAATTTAAATAATATTAATTATANANQDTVNQYSHYNNDNNEYAQYYNYDQSNYPSYSSQSPASSQYLQQHYQTPATESKSNFDQYANYDQTQTGSHATNQNSTDQYSGHYDQSQYNNQYATNSANQYSNDSAKQYSNEATKHYANEPANQYANNQYSSQYSNNQYANTQYANNQYSNGQYSNDQYSNHYANTQYSNQYDNYYQPQTQYASNETQPQSTYASSYSTPASTSYSSWTPQQTGTADALLFSRPHPVVSFGFCGKLAIFRPSSGFVDSRVLRVESIRTVLQRSPFLEPFATFPGPLTSGTSKDTVSRWISSRIAQSNDEGASLLWELLKVMGEHYGSLARSPDSSSNPEAAVQKLLLDPHERFDLPAAAVPTPASLLGNTLTTFATTVLPEGSPLRTMYLLYARQPQEIFKAIGSNSQLLEKWKANLGAILAANPASHPSSSQSNTQSQNDRRVAAELGDRLWAVQGRVEAAHCCYLLADLALGPYDNPSTRIVLLGADHKRKRATAAPQQRFPSNFVVNLEAIQRSEIYEWSKVLGNSQYVLPGIHPYKLLYATVMADLGFADVAAQYVQQLTAAVRAHKGGGQNFTPHYLYQLDTLEERLRGTGAAKSLTASGSWFPRMLTKGFSRFLGSEKPASPSMPAQASSESLKKVPSKTSVRPEPTPSKEEEEYAAAFSNKPAKKQEAKEEEKETKEDTKGGKEGEKAGEVPQQGKLLSRLAFWKKSGTEAKLGEENAFEYNADLKMWVEKGKPLPQPEAPLPPPPTSFPTSMPTIPSSAPGAPPSSAGGAPPPGTPPPGMGGSDPTRFTSPMASGGRRKPRYFDSLNDQVYTTNGGRGGTPTATPEKSNVNIFTPFTPPPSTFSPPPQEQNPAPNTPPPQ